MNLPDEITQRLEERVEKLKQTFGSKNVKIDANYLAIFAIKKYLDKKDHQERSGNCNSGTAWRKFTAAHGDEIFMRDRGRCFYCQQRLHRDNYTLDHKLPVSRGGGTNIKNVVLSCYWCNVDKGSLTTDEYQYKQLHNAAQGIRPPNPNDYPIS